MRFYVVGTVEGEASSESERKKPGDSSPTQLLPEGHRFTGCRCQGHSGPGFGVSSTHTVYVFIALSAGFPSPLLAPAVSSVCSPWCCPVLNSPVLFHFHPHFSILYPGLSFSCFLSAFSMQMESCSRDPPSPPAIKEKTDPRRQTLPLGCWKQAS